jgi:FKBP-type peptidyl-prolyl cis-trans isomerase (trigger factor)
VLTVKRKLLPAWDEALAQKIRPEMTLALLESEVRQAIEGDGAASTENTRNDAIASALLEILSMKKLPESLVDETTQSRFETMLMDFKEQGSTAEQIEEMTTEANFKRYKEISRPNVEKIVKLGMAFRDIAEKEKVEVEEKEIREQLDLLMAQTKQKNEQPPDERRARDEIENTLLRRKVFNMLAATADITWIDPPVEPSQV